MVEGGASVIATFMKLEDPDGKPMVDMHIVTVAPKVIGMSGVKATDPDVEVSSYFWHYRTSDRCSLSKSHLILSSLRLGYSERTPYLHPGC